MAKNGSLNTSTYTYPDDKNHSLGLTFSWSIKSQTATSVTIKYSLIGFNNKGTSYSYNSGPFEIKFDNKQVFYDATRRHVTNGTVICQDREYTFTTSEYASKSFKVDVTAALYYSSYNVSGSKTFTIDAKERPTYTVIFDANGGTRTGGGELTQTVVLGGSATVPIVSRTGYTLTGWDGAYTDVNSDRTITANWKANTYTVSFDANGGENAPASQKKVYGINLVLSEDIPTRSGYDFVGWSTSVNGSVQYQSGGSYTIDEDITLYAVWEKKTNCFIKHNGTYKMGMMYVKDNGTYKTGEVTVKHG